ncbi:Glucosyltransferase [Sulfitobacter noctilucicola]|uniref:Glycosyltransferase involved in cell wall biosynthesis n=1 Tax=Sulfitobacter noctilucicola TaxID=1342301 RepID=A0A7W6M8I8_9RHOB|nr:glycosyltransferase family A protein [Sulfitobacter noctilucicola]KIN64482.1 Glucosyltransferase [Sulfitobacter noctilucicola]MBB4174359.1 glycosyltransferase involved in cell wall biosynthesis [Sulfitobacter noctilucicola]
MPIASIIVPAFNVADTLPATLKALLAQTFDDYEIIVVDDGSTDTTSTLLQEYANISPIRVITQRNRGLAGARNTGISLARGEFIGFCDADDLWVPEKLALHVAHLQSAPHVGVSFSGSALINDEGDALGMAQSPRLTNITAAHIFKRNPIGNGSAPVIRKAVFDAIAHRPASEKTRDWYFDETFRQSEDIECWLRIALTTNWQFEGIAGDLTHYRINAGGLSAATDLQLAAWERMIAKLSQVAPSFFSKNAKSARSYQLRYLSRRAISDKDTGRAIELLKQSFRQSWSPLWEEPVKSLTTIAAALVLRYAGPLALDALMARRGAAT